MGDSPPPRREPEQYRQPADRRDAEQQSQPRKPSHLLARRPAGDDDLLRRRRDRFQSGGGRDGDDHWLAMAVAEVADHFILPRRGSRETPAAGVIGAAAGEFATLMVPNRHFSVAGRRVVVGEERLHDDGVAFQLALNAQIVRTGKPGWIQAAGGRQQAINQMTNAPPMTKE